MAREALECSGHGEVKFAAMARSPLRKRRERVIWVERDGASGSCGCARRRRGCEQEELGGDETRTVNFAVEVSSAVAELTKEEREERRPALVKTVWMRLLAVPAAA